MAKSMFTKKDMKKYSGIAKAKAEIAKEWIKEHPFETMAAGMVAGATLTWLFKKKR